MDKGTGVNDLQDKIWDKMTSGPLVTTPGYSYNF